MLIKICCIKNLKEAQTALSMGADLLGLVSEMPSGPGVISLAEISSIVSALPASTKTVLLSSRTRAREIIRQHQEATTWGIQLVDSISTDELILLRKKLPNTILIQVIHVQDHTALPCALQAAPMVNYLLLDSGRPEGPTRTLGGTGNTHDWSISSEIIRQSSTPVFLAGGLDASNVTKAIMTTQPAGVDLCSGVRSGDVLDPEKLAQFFSLTAALT